MSSSPARHELRLTLEGAGVGLAVGLATVWPWTGDGHLLLLDWVSGPNATLNPGVYGLSGSSLDAMPFRVGTQALRAVVGPATTAWLLVLAVFPLLAGGVAHLVRGGRWRRMPAALASVLNPFVVERVGAGHVAFLLGLAIMPWLAASAEGARLEGRRFSARTAGWFALAVAVSPHAAWLGGLVLLAGALLPRPRAVDLVRTALVVLATTAVYAYAAVLWAVGTRTIAVSQADLDAYAVAAGPGGAWPTVLSLHGFWRDTGLELPRDALGAWGPVVLVVVVFAVAAGALRSIRRRPTLGQPWAALTLLALPLALGVVGPLAGPYRWALDHLPLFPAMREQEKWLGLAAIGYALFLGELCDALAARSATMARGARRIVLLTSASAIAALPFTSAPSLLGGLGGHVELSTYPSSWAAADELMGSGDAGVLVLPWHGYQPFSFTEGRTVATPGAAFFRRPVLSSDAVELPGLRTDSTSARTAAVDRILAAGPASGELAARLAPFGIRYVVLARGTEDDRWSWVDADPSLRLVLDRPEIRVWQAPDPLSPRLSRTSATSWTVVAGTPGRIVLPEEWSPGWRLDGRSGTRTPEGTIAWEVDGGAHTVRYAPWALLRWGVLASVLALLALVASGVAEHRHSIRAALRR